VAAGRLTLEETGVNEAVAGEPTMASSRLEKIQAMLADNPDDVFLRYSLAMELQKAGRHQESLSGLGELMGGETPYVPAFFMAARQLANLGELDEARGMLRAGIEQAREQGDLHAAGEMSEFLASLGQSV
jgi:thioredoxin-like negative regulator of GroEL